MKIPLIAGRLIRQITGDKRTFATVIIPQMMFCGLINLRETPLVLQWLAKIFPLTYGADALRDVMLRGRGFGDICGGLLVMLGFTTLFIILNIQALKKYREI